MIADFDLTAPLPEGTVLLEASAGTGKTFSIAHLAVRYVAERRVPIDKLLVVTFTDAATSELSERIRARIRDAIDALDGREAGDDVLRAWAQSSRKDPAEAAQRRLHLMVALANFDAASISTIHGFCRRVLSQAAFESSADEGAELLTDTSALHRDVVFDHLTNALTRLSADEYELLGDLRSTGTLTVFVEELIRNPKARVLPEGQGKAAAIAHFEQSLTKLRDAIRIGASSLQAELERAIAGKILKGDTAKNPELLRRAFEALLARRERRGLLTGEERMLFRLLRRGEFLNATKKKSWGDLATDPILDALEDLVEADAHVGLELRLELLHPLVSEVREKLPARKRKLGIVTFQDLLQLVETSVALPDSPLVRLLRTRYDVALIDEFQDTDPVQWTIFRSVFHDGNKPLWLIGDPKQAIYSFRGADLEVYFQARDCAHARYRLGTNRRSDEPLVDAVNRLFTRPGAFRHPKLDYEAVQAANDARLELGGKRPAPLRIHVGAGSRKKDAIVDWVQSEVLGFLQSGAEIALGKGDDGTPKKRKVTPRDCAVLVGTNRRAREIRDALREVGVPSVLRSDESVFATEEAAELGIFLRAIAGPEQMSRLLAFLATRIAGCDAAEIDQVRRDETTSADWVERLGQWAKLYRDHGLMHTVRAMASEMKVEERLASLPGAERRLADFFHVAELLHAAQHDAGLDPEELALYLDRERAEESASDEARKVRLETDADAVEIVTVHRSKGLEYPVVFCADLFEVRRSDRFPLRYAQNGERILHVAPDFDSEAKELASQSALEESLRLSYVALTRAKNFCSVLYLPGPKTSLRTSALDWLFFGHLDEKARQKASAEPLDPLREIFGSTGGIEIVQQGFEPRAERYEPTSDDANELSAAVYQRRQPLDSLWRWASFSSVVGNRRAEGYGEIKEDDEGESVNEPGEKRLPLSIAALEGASTSAHLGSFRHGKELGSLVHEVFETIDFAEPGDLAAAIQNRLPTFGLEGRLRKHPELVESAAKMIADTLATEIVAHDDRFTLREIGKGDRQSEMRFAFPVGHLSVKALARVFDRHSPERKEYAKALARIRNEDLAGLVHGSIDLVFRRGERFYVADFKTNHLGDELGHYHPKMLERAMHEKHYHLQAYLYALALHRQLKLRLRDYDPETHFGGIFFFFVRGMTPATGSRFGIHFDKPHIALLRELDGLFFQGGKA